MTLLCATGKTFSTPAKRGRVSVLANHRVGRTEELGSLLG
jgi:hypothetical protein